MFTIGQLNSKPTANDLWRKCSSNELRWMSTHSAIDNPQRATLGYRRRVTFQRFHRGPINPRVPFIMCTQYRAVQIPLAVCAFSRISISVPLVHGTRSNGVFGVTYVALIWHPIGHVPGLKYKYWYISLHFELKFGY